MKKSLKQAIKERPAAPDGAAQPMNTAALEPFASISMDVSKINNSKKRLRNSNKTTTNYNKNQPTQTFTANVPIGARIGASAALRRCSVSPVITIDVNAVRAIPVDMRGS